MYFTSVKLGMSAKQKAQYTTRTERTKHTVFAYCIANYKLFSLELPSLSPYFRYSRRKLVRSY